jgi:hypothetical protein
MRHNSLAAKRKPMSKLVMPIVGLSTAALLAGPVIREYRTDRWIVGNYVAVSDSDRKFQPQIGNYCRHFLDRLKDNDYLINAKFADRVHLESSNLFEAKNLAQLQSECDRATTKPTGIGINKGTDLAAAVAHLATQISMARTHGQNQSVRATISIDAAEPVKGKKTPTARQLIQSVNAITKDGGKLVIVGSEDNLQNELIKQLADRSNVKICPWKNAESCALDWLMSR